MGTLEYPSVTTVCKILDKGPQLEAWKKRVGEAEAERLRSRGAARGTALHSAVEHYISGSEQLAEDLKQPITASNFKTLRPLIDAHINNVYCFETTVASKELETAGRLDLFAEWDGEPALIDAKTTTKKRSPSFYETYKLQCSAYCFMLKEMVGIDVRKFYLIFATDEGESFMVSGDREDYIGKFKAAREAYRAKYQSSPT